MAEYRYPLDLSGTLPGNRVIQKRTLNMMSKMGDKFFIPDNAPFFAEGAVVYKTGTPTPLVRGVDFEFIFDYPDIFLRTQKEVFGGVKFKDRNISGEVRIEMQVVGGPFLQPIPNILETVARNKTNVNTCTWGELAGVPAGFPVLNHPMISDDFTGFGEMNTTLRGIEAALLANGPGGGGGDAAMVALRAHIQNPTNAHNKSAVGLGNVPNFSMSTYEEADLGVNNKLTSPALVKYLISKYSGISSITTIQSQIAGLNREVVALQQGLQDNNIKVSQLNTRVTDLSNQFTSVKQEFANILIYINDLGGSIENIQGVVTDIKNQVTDALARVTAMEQTVAQIKLENENISTVLAKINNDLTGLSNRVDTLEQTSMTMALSITKLNNATLYPLRRFINTGSFHFSIRAGETRQLTLIGAGGAGGILIPVGEDGITDPRGRKGGDTVLYLNTDLTNGNNIAGEIVLRANGGFGGQSSKQSGSGIDKFGKGGAGGQTAYTGMFNIITNAIGAGGLDGSTTASGNNAGAIGQTIQGKSFGSGGAALGTVGSGGAGAMIVASITNTHTFDLDFTVRVGDAGENIFGNNLVPATPGLFAIDLA